MKTTPAVDLCRANAVELFQVTAQSARDNRSQARKDGHDAAQCLHAGFYYWTCTPGCLPDSDALGPFRSFRAAALDAVDTFDLDQDDAP